MATTSEPCPTARLTFRAPDATAHRLRPGRVSSSTDTTVGSLASGRSAATTHDHLAVRMRLGVVVVSGALDTESAPRLAAVLRPFLAAGGHVRVSLREVTFMGSAGLHVLDDAAAALEDRGRLVLLNPSSVVTRLIELVGVRESIDVVANQRLRVVD